MTFLILGSNYIAKGLFLCLNFIFHICNDQSRVQDWTGGFALARVASNLFHCGNVP